jgi:4'-phosphopantetheinyl transferase
VNPEANRTLISFSQGVVEVVSLPLTAPPEELARLENTLSLDERQRASGYRYERHRHRFIVSRGRLRQILATRVHVPADRIRFDYGPNGKPTLAGDHALRFNVSHSDELLLIASCRNRDVGIDVEQVRPLPDLQSISREVCSRGEQTRLALQDHRDRLPLFLRLWTCKEAWLKAQGKGLSEGLDLVDMSSVLDRRSSRHSAWQRGPTSIGWLHELAPARDHVAAVALMVESR